MKTKIQNLIIALALFAGSRHLAAQGTAFTYQGRLNLGGNAANGSYDLRFAIFDAASSGYQQGATLTNAATAVSNGLFTATLDFGNPFSGANRWLEIGVRTNGGGAFTTLTPRQALTPTPYAIYAGTAGWAATANAASGVPATGIGAGTANISITGNAATADTATTATTALNFSGAVADAQLSGNLPRLNGTNVFTGTNFFAGTVIATNPANQISGTFSGSGTGLTTLSANALAAGSITADKLAPGAVSWLGAPNGSPTNALLVDTNGNIGVGVSAPTAGLQISSAANQTTLQTAFEVSNGDAGYTNLLYPNLVAAQGNLLAVGGFSGVTLVDISAPSWPALQAQLVGGTAPFNFVDDCRGIAWAGTTLVVSSGNNRAITFISCTNPASPVKVAELRGWNYLDGAYNVAVAGNLLAVAAFNSSAVTLADISNPSAPVLRSSLVNGTYGFNNLAGAVSVAFAGNLLAIGAYSSGAVTLVNVADPTNPQKLAVLQDGVGGYSISGVDSVALAGNLLAIAANGNNTVTLVDVANPANPQKLAVLQDGVNGYSLSGVSSVTMAGNRLAISAYGSSAVTLVDVSTPAKPVLLATATDGVNGADYLGGASGIALAGTNLVACGNLDNGLTILGIGTQAVGLESAGWVGIGTTHPQAALDVVGNVVVENATLFNVNASHVALGENTISSGIYSTALGASTTASGDTSTALGYHTTASGSTSTALGFYTKASGNTSTALGYNTTASGQASTALGLSTTASGISSTALGTSTKASGDYSTAMGFSTTASGNNSTAIGNGSMATSNNATALGDGAKASGADATALGNGTTASGYSSTALGYSTTASGDYSTALGYFTTASGQASTALGTSTKASGDNSTAMGSYAQATNSGSLVWADSSNNALTSSTNNNSLTFRAAGGYRLFSNSGMSAGVSLAPGGTAWATISDQNAKKNFAAVNGQAVLAKLATVPVQQWNYKWDADSDVPNIGPMAQAFKQAFYPGRDDKTITTLEFDGVELAAIQGLNEKLERENAALKARLEKLERAISTLTGGGK